MDMHDMAMRMFGDSSPSNTAPAGSTMVDTPPTQTPTQVLFGDATAVPEPLTKSEPRTDAEMAEGLYAEEETPPADAPDDEDMQAIRRDAAMFPAEAEKAIALSEFDVTLGVTGLVDGQEVTVTKPILRKAVSEIRAMTADIGMNQQEAADFVANIKRIGTSKPIPDDQRIPNREKAVDMLNREHGNEAARALKAARRYIAKNPKLASILERSGLGDDPETVATIARRALGLVRAGKLRLK